MGNIEIPSRTPPQGVERIIRMKIKILITGATGFIGSFIVEEALKRDMEVWAAVRQSSSTKYLQDNRINFIELDFSSRKKLIKQLFSRQFDYVVHAAGVTKCLHKEDFFNVNTKGTENFVEALLQLQMPIRRFIYISSLSIYGAIHENKPYREIREDDIPRPNTAYGKSKLEAEKYLEAIGNDFPYIVLRPTGVYGPRERDYFMMAKSIKKHVDFSVGFKHQDITFVYVKDLVQAVFLALDRGMTDGNVYQSSTFSTLIRNELGRPWWIRIKAPIWALQIITWAGEKLSHYTGRVTALNKDKFNILKQRNWRCDIDELGFHPRYNLEQGVKETISWYIKNGWL